jgi:SAM-dependent methyltransferase
VTVEDFYSELADFDGFGTSTSTRDLVRPSKERIPVLTNEFWTARQRLASSLHEVSYRACFKPQLPRFFIERLTKPQDLVYDPFMGRGTTVLEAALLGRRAAGCDVNPLSSVLVAPRLDPPDMGDVQTRLQEIDWNFGGALPEELLAFYHPDTLRQICALREELCRRRSPADAWIRMVATNRLTGHSKGFFSVYTMPPNQAVSIESQRRINQRRGQAAEPRNVAAIVMAKTASLLSRISVADRERLNEFGRSSILMTGSSLKTPDLEDEQVSLIVTSPPFLDVVDYQTDNWLRCWFNSIDTKSVRLWITRRVDEWSRTLAAVFQELHRVLKPGGLVAFEVGEIRGGKLLLENVVIPAAETARLRSVLILVNQQKFTKTSHCWGVSNMGKGTNTNRIVLLQKP